MNPLVTNYTGRALVEPRYFGSIAYYACVAQLAYPVMNTRLRYDKRNKATHRTTIADVNGPLRLTVPVTHPEGLTGPLTWADMRLSAHGSWWDVHRVALESAYGRTPFFEFYIDRFLPVLTREVMDRFDSVAALDSFIDAQIREILQLPESLACTEVKADCIISEPRELIMPPYYQLRRDKLGFIPGLSILDLIFNIGPEAQLYLKQLAAQ